MVTSLGLPSLPLFGGGSCPGGSLDPVCQVLAGGASSLVGAGAGAVLAAVAASVATGAAWLLGQVGAVLAASGRIDLQAPWFGAHYAVVLAAAVLLPLLLLGIIQAVARQQPSMLLRIAFVQLPLALLLSAVAVQVVRLSLSVVDAMCRTLSPDGGVVHALAGLAGELVSASAGSGLPPFVLLLGSALVVLGGVALWIELLVRSAAVYLAVLFLPLGLASLAWPAVAHWCRRLVETLAALALSKLVIVAALVLGVGELGGGSGFAGVLGGAAMLLLAAFAPFALLRLVPMVEAGAVHQMEGMRQRMTRSLGAGPRRAASYALASVRAAGLDIGSFGTGALATADAPGPSGAPAGPHAAGPSNGVAGTATAWPATPQARRPAAPPDDADAGPSNGVAGGPPGLPRWRGSPESNRAFAEVLGGARAAEPDEPTVALLRPLPVRSSADGRRWAPESHEIGHDELGPVVRWRPGPASEQR
jgi:hypothetical protein